MSGPAYSSPQLSPDGETEEAARLAGLPPWAVPLLQRLQGLEEVVGRIQAALDTDGDGRVDVAAAAPRLRALVTVAIGALGVLAYALTPETGRVMRDLLILLGILGALGVGEAALVARLLDRGKQ